MFQQIQEKMDPGRGLPAISYKMGETIPNAKKYYNNTKSYGFFPFGLTQLVLWRTHQVNDSTFNIIFPAFAIKVFSQQVAAHPAFCLKNCF